MGAQSHRIRVGLSLAVAACVTVCAALAASQTGGAPPPGGPIGPPSTPQRLSGVEPRDPYRQIADGLLARTRFADAKGRPFAVEVLDLIVGPGKTTAKTRLPGAAVIEVRSGKGTLAAGGKTRDLTGGTSSAVDDGDEVTFANLDREAPLILRATLVRRSQ
jgi:hypothetical protein